MSLEATIQENTTALRELIAAIKAGLPTTAAQIAASVAEAKPVTAAEMPRAKKAIPAPEVPSVTEKKDEPSEQAATPNYQATADAVTKLARTHGRDAAVAVLQKFGASKLPDVTPEQFAAVIAACKEAGGVEV